MRDLARNLAKFVFVTSGTSHHAAIDQFGRLYSWGNSTDGALGHTEEKDEFQPKINQLYTHLHVADVSCGDKFTALIAVPQSCGKETLLVKQFKQGII